jgi:hypothetical protein
MVTKQCQVEFKIGRYRDDILCDVIPMDVCHVLLRRPWNFERNAIHGGRNNTYTLEKNGRTHIQRILNRGTVIVHDKAQKPKVETGKPKSHLERGGSSRGRQYSGRNVFI